MRTERPRHVRQLVIASVAAALLASASASAFAPRSQIPLQSCSFALGGILYAINGCDVRFPFLFVNRNHETITRDALFSFDMLRYGTFTWLMKRAADDIVDANADVDLNQFIASAHFDGENFSGGQTRLVNLRNAIATALQAGDARLARINLGMALHTIQDFYSHTNYVELNYSIPAGLGRPGVSLSGISALEPTCAEGALGLVGAGGAGFLIGQGLLQLTSGYYGGEDRQSQIGTNQAARKCTHGGPFDSLGWDGISKDTAIPIASPHSTDHDRAADLATLATEQFLGDLSALPTVTAAGMAALLGADALVLHNNNNASTITVNLALDLFVLGTPGVMLAPQTDKQFSLPNISRSGAALMLTGVNSTPSATGLVGYTLSLPAVYEFISVISDRGTTTSLTGLSTHTDLLVLKPASGPAHRANTYLVRRKP